MCAEICCLKAGKVEGRKELVLSKCFKAAPKKPAPTFKFIHASTTQSVLHLRQKDQKYPALGPWKLLPGICYFKWSSFLNKEEIWNSYLQYKIPCKDKVLVETYCRAHQQEEHHLSLSSAQAEGNTLPVLFATSEGLHII